MFVRALHVRVCVCVPRGWEAASVRSKHAGTLAKDDIKG